MSAPVGQTMLGVAKKAREREAEMKVSLLRLRNAAFAAHYALEQSLRLKHTVHTRNAWRVAAEKLKAALLEADGAVTPTKKPRSRSWSKKEPGVQA